MGTLLNIVPMQIAWFACVLGAAHGMGWIGTLASVAVAALHLSRARDPKVELTLILCAVALGMLIDSSLASASLLTFASDVWIEGFTTHWMLGLWIGFATTLNASLAWVLRSLPVAVAFGAIGGPLAYWSGAKLGALSLIEGTLPLVAIGIAWAGAMAAFVLLVRRLHTAEPERAVA